MANFLFKCERCGYTEMIPAVCNQRRFCADCYRIGWVDKRREARQRERDERAARRKALGLPPEVIHQKTGPGIFKKAAFGCEVCCGVPDRRPRDGCVCGKPYAEEGRDGRWRPPQGEKAG